jgi:DNA-binding CsgD family transcriptional regulator
MIRIEMRESHDPDVVNRQEGTMLRGVLRSKSIPAARSLDETIAGEDQSFLQSALKRPDADTVHINASCLGLTARQRDVLAFMLQGKSNKAICRVLNLAVPTVKNHVTAILKTLKVTNRTEAVIKVSKTAVALPSFTSTISGYHAYRYGVWMANLDRQGAQTTSSFTA